MSNKAANLMLSLLIAVASMAVIGISPARQAWLINAWSVQYTHHALSPSVKQSVISVPPAGHARAALWLASDALQSGNPALAETLIASQVARGDQFAMHLTADALLAQGDFAGAVAIWQQAGDAALLLQAASQAQEAGRLEEALMAYEASWTLDPEEGTLPLAYILRNYRQDFNTAENVLRQSLATLPNSSHRSEWSNLLGDLLRTQKRWDEAAATYESAIVQAPEDWTAYIGLGWARYEHGDGLQAALSEFQKVINAPKSQGDGQFAIAQVLTRENRFEEADAWFVQALALNPNPWWYLARGNAAQQTGNLTLAMAVYQETLEQFPDFEALYMVYYEMAYAYRTTEQPAQAMAAIERMMALLSPTNAYYYSFAGGIYEWAGDTSQALHAYRQALLIDPQNAAALNGVERLDK